MRREQGNSSQGTSTLAVLALLFLFLLLRLNAPLFNFFCLSTRTFGTWPPTISLAPFSFFLASPSLWSFFDFLPFLAHQFPHYHHFTHSTLFNPSIPSSHNRRPWFVFVNDPAIFFFPFAILYAKPNADEFSCN